MIDIFLGNYFLKIHRRVLAVTQVLVTAFLKLQEKKVSQFRAITDLIAARRACTHITSDGQVGRTMGNVVVSEISAVAIAPCVRAPVCYASPRVLELYRK